MNRHGAEYLYGVLSEDARNICKSIPLLFPDDPDTFARPSSAVRSSRSAIVDRTSASDLLYLELWSLFEVFNRSYNFKLSTIEEPIQIIRYADGGCVDWHIDVGDYSNGLERKLSISVQLSSSTDYSGGDLEFIAQPSAPFSRTLGTVIGFPSYCAHRVTQVKRGERFSLVAFALGEPFV